jgi:hypothetical protein
MAVGAGALFWVTYPVTTYGEAFYSCSLSSCSTMMASPKAYQGPTTGPIPAIAGDATNIYWPWQGNIVSCPRTGCATPTVLAPTRGSGAASLYGSPQMRLDASELFWLESLVSGDSGILRCATSGCGGSAALVASGASWGHAFNVDATHVYWKQGTQFLKAPRNGGTPALVATSPGPDSAAVVDSTYFYWAENGPTVTIYRIEK